MLEKPVKGVSFQLTRTELVALKTALRHMNKHGYNVLPSYGLSEEHVMALIDLEPKVEKLLKDLYRVRNSG